MRPPSYYTSLANSNSSSYNRSGNTSSPYSSSLPTSHQQLRSSFSSSSSSSYVTRSHLPYVSQSMLVAHCITGGGSTTKPYGVHSTTSSRPSSNYLSSISGNSYGRSYTGSSSSYHLSSRPNSTKRNPYLASSTANSKNYSRPSSSYLSNSSSTNSTLSHSSYRPSSGYNYKPIRLRERPLLTQISRQINTASPTKAPISSTLNNVDRQQSTRFDHSDNNQQTSGGENIEPEENNWSSDVARNISRNKYLIKFREFDKRNSISPVQLIDTQLENNIKESDLVLSKQEPNRLEAGEEKMKLPLSETVKSSELPEKQHYQLTVDPKVVETTSNQKICDNKQQPDLGEVKKPKAVPKEKKNIKLKLKTLNTSSCNELEKKSKQENLTSTIDKIAPNNSKPLAEQENIENEKVIPSSNKEKSKAPPSVGKTQSSPKEDDSPNTKTKLKKLVKKSSSKTSIEPSGTNSVIQKPSDSINKSPPDTGKKLALKKVSKQTDDSSVVDSKKVKKSEQKIADERKVFSLKQTSDNKSICNDNVESDENLNLKKKKKQTKLVTLSQKVANTVTSNASAEKLSKSANPSGESSPICSSNNNNNNNNISNSNKRIRFREYKYDDFNFLSVLGHGGWGFVILAELKDHDACFAVKCIKKITIVEDDDFDSIMIERKVLTLGNVHPFICKLFCTFETEGYLFFVMEYCAGGDLMFHVQKEGKFTESRCRFYAAEIICAIRFLHNRHIIYRDLKLDNILLDSKGHVRLVDFGMCQCRTYREEMLPSNFCGTPEYISPEIIKGVPYNHSVDWWSFGVLLYEMAVGKMPFRGNDENELLWNVCYEQIHYPMFLTKELTSLLQLLLEREPIKRMGMSTCKAGDICDQPWFRGVDWHAIEGMRVTPPFVPEVNCKRDVQNFDADFTQSTPELSPVDASTLERIDQNQFQKFPYTNPNIFIFD